MTFKIYIDDQLYKPLNLGEIDLTIELEQESGSYQYVRGIEGSPKFKCDVKKFIEQHGECQKIEFRVEETCPEGVFDVFKGFFTLRDCEISLIDEIITIKDIYQDSLYECVKRNMDKTINFLRTPDIVTAEYVDKPTYEYTVKTTDDELPFFGDYIRDGVGSSPFLGFYAYAREVKTTYCNGGEPNPPTGSGWQVLYNKCESEGLTTWWREAPSSLGTATFGVTFCSTPCVPPAPAVTAANEDWLLMDTLTTPSLTASFWVDQNDLISNTESFDNGRPLLSVIDYLLNEISCSRLNVVSEYLTNAVNPVTGASPSSTKDLQLHAISDIKSPNASIEASLEETTLKEVLEGIVQGKLNAFWRVDENLQQLVIEHWVDLVNGNTFDLTKWQKFTQVFEYDNTDVPRYEEFPSLDKQIDFTGIAIEYPNDCADGKKAYATDKFHTDVKAIYTEPDDFGNDGVVLIASLSLNPSADNAEVGAITGEYEPNLAVGMANLHDKFWGYYRPFKGGIMNFEAREFLNNRPIHKLETVEGIEISCFYLFNPFDLFRGKLVNVENAAGFANGRLQSATLNLSTKLLNVDIKY